MTNLDRKILYQALLKKDPSYEGVFIVGVKTTGIFCRPTCRSRKPKLENTEFFSTAREAQQKGYRPCKVCRPTEHSGSSPDWMRPLTKRLENGGCLRMDDAEIRELGIDPNRVRRWFKQNYKMTFQGYLRSLRVGKAFGHLSKGGKVIDAAFEHGYESLSGFTNAFRNLTGVSPSIGKKSDIMNVYQITTPLGPMIAASTSQGICLLEFTDRRGLETEFKDLQKRLKMPIVTSLNSHIENLGPQLDEYFLGKRTQFDVPLVTPGSEFQNLVWRILKEIPYGETRSYKDQAISIKNSKAVRAVARANGENRISILIPCHRVIGSNGEMVGYGGGIWRKKRLLELEQRR